MSCGAIGGWRASCAQDSGDWVERMSSVVDVLEPLQCLCCTEKKSYARHRPVQLEDMRRCS